MFLGMDSIFMVGDGWEDDVDQLPHVNADGFCSIILRPCPTATVAELLDPSVPFVWVVGHSPRRVLQWWEVDLPITRGERPRRLQVRSLWCELLFDTRVFVEVALYRTWDRAWMDRLVARESIARLAF